MRSSYGSSQIAQQFINCCAFYEFTKCAAKFINCANSQIAPNSNITKYAIKTGNITQVTLLTNVTRYLSNIVTVTNLILRNIITTSNEVTNLVSNPLSNA